MKSEREAIEREKAELLAATKGVKEKGKKLITMEYGDWKKCDALLYPAVSARL